MTRYVLHAEPLKLNFSRVSFRYGARDCLSCFEAYDPSEFSPVKYFLLCRTIELALKALHLDSMSVEDVRKKFGHNIASSYDGSDEPDKILSDKERQFLSDTNKLHEKDKKALEYIQPYHAVTGYSDFPDLAKLYELAKKLVEYVEASQNENPLDPNNAGNFNDRSHRVAAA